MTEIKPPGHLSKATAAWFADVASTFELSGDQSRVLQIACESFDLAQQARAILKKDGLVVGGDRGGKRAHPLHPDFEFCVGSLPKGGRVARPRRRGRPFDTGAAQA